MEIMPGKIHDLLNEPSTAYIDLDSDSYSAEKGLLELYRSFVSEMLKISLAGVAVLGFLSKFLTDGDKLAPCPKFYGTISMFSFALSSALCLLFLYLSSEGYRYYIAGLRASEANNVSMAKQSLRDRKIILKFCLGSKIGSAILIAIGAFSACMAIFKLV